MSGRRALCRAEEIAEGEARGFPPPPGGLTGLVALRRGGEIRVYVNACPHLGLPLELLPGRFLDASGRHLVCSAHGARFRVEDGRCISGPCSGEALESVPCEIDPEGLLTVPAEAGR
ncbi:MAG: Rieske 2Fe-2S domain-containing protein [Acetobacteraceae bacterium]|nr:Rieske 2Fe-2S domain-containing protein [Acetobacteraceae bacterium]